ncbi:ead/Ea22-like family protein [Klebsiella pneumoniae]|nr:ead/Ea22-like family protein [Klebsiella pneumoniae]
MTDITELAQREKFEAWWERTQHNGNPPRFGWSRWRDGEGYKVDDDNSELDGMWSAWKAAGAELVEVLENANRYIERLREWNAGLAQESCERQQLISELEPIRAAAEKLVRCKGCYHSEQNYRSLAALFGVTTPDLPPLEHENVHYADAAEMEIAALRQRIAELESRTVKLPESFKLAKSSSGLTYYYADEVDAALTDAGIKVEDE